MIGCDIINLNHHKSQTHWYKNKRILRYLGIPDLYLNEIIRFYPKKGYWIIWAAIEAAYKCVTKLDAERFNRPSRFAWQDIAQTKSGMVCFFKYKELCIQILTNYSVVDNSIQAIAILCKALVNTLPENITFTNVWHHRFYLANATDKQVKYGLWKVLARNLRKPEINSSNTYTFSCDGRSFAYCLSHDFGAGLLVYQPLEYLDLPKNNIKKLVCV